MAKQHIVEAEVLSDISNGYRLKVSVLDVGLYMYGWTARHSERSKSGWWIQPPAVKTGGIWKPTVEFDKSKSLWIEIEPACIDAVQVYQHSDKVGEITDEELTPEAIKKSLNEAWPDVDEVQPKAIPWMDDKDS